MVDPTDTDIWREEAYINGKWVGSDDRFPVDNPANGAEIASVTNCSVDQVEATIAATDRAWASWRTMTGKERGQILRQWFDLMMEHREPFVDDYRTKCIVSGPAFLLRREQMRRFDSPRENSSSLMYSGGKG